MKEPLVGIIANPVSARDIRRVISYAGSLQITDRANLVLRVLAGMASVGVRKTVMMPENAGIGLHLRRNLERARKQGAARFPDLVFLDMPVTGDAVDSRRAARAMREMGVAAIVVLGGDGTHRIVVQECGNTPIAGVSTGTNNAFPEMREPTVTGLAVGLAVTGQVPTAAAFRFSKRLDVQINDLHEIALVDVAIVKERYIGARAIWRADSLRELFVTFGEPGGTGMSSIIGLAAPVSRSAAHGRHAVFGPLGKAPYHVSAPVAPGLIERFGIEQIKTLSFDDPRPLSMSAGTIALDGEREISFSESDAVSVTLRESAFRTVDVPSCMAHAAGRGHFVEVRESHHLVQTLTGRNS